MTAGDAAKRKSAFYKTLYFQVIAGIVPDIVFGYFAPSRAVDLWYATQTLDIS